MDPKVFLGNRTSKGDLCKMKKKDLNIIGTGRGLEFKTTKRKSELLFTVLEQLIEEGYLPE